MRALVLGLALLLCSCACGSGAAAHVTSASPSVKGVVLQAQDFPTLHKCPQSDRWAGLMLVGEPEMLPTGYPSWAELQAAGAKDGWLSIYADLVPDCPLLFGHATPQGRLVYTVAIKFKDASSAATSFASDSQGFPVAGYFAARFTAAGGSVTTGTPTGFGMNSVIAMISERGVPTYVAFWQKKDYEAIVWADNFSAPDARSAVTVVNGRIN